jgi:hypothetical protein
MAFMDRQRAAAMLARGKGYAGHGLRRVGLKVGKRARRRIAGGSGVVAALRRGAGQQESSQGRQDSAAATPVFFVIGQKKSGTTWLQKMLDAHPEIVCDGEGRFFGADWRHENLKETRLKQQPSSLYNAMLDAEYMKLWIQRSPWSRDGNTDEHLKNLTRMAVDYFMQSRLAGSGKSMVADKSPLLTPNDVKEISEIYPETRVIHIIRDGRDAAVSAAHHVWNFGNVENKPRVKARRDAYREDPESVKEQGGIFIGKQLLSLAKEWQEKVGGAARQGRRYFGNRYMEVKYEDLLQRPEEELKRMLEFLGADSGAEIAERCVSQASFESLGQGRQRGQEDPTAFVRKGVAGDWKNVFTERNKRTFKNQAGELLVQLGYEEDQDW